MNKSIFSSCLSAAFLAIFPARGQEPVNTYWIKLNGWNMSSSAENTKSFGLAGIQHTNIVAVAAIIHSDAVSGKVEVDRLDRSGWGETHQIDPPYDYRGRGGIMEVSSSSNCLFLYRGPDHGNYRNGSWGASRFQLGLHTQTSANRGWVRIDYMGTPVNASQPYAMKTKVISMGSWDLTTVFQKNVNLSNLGMPANRITSFNATLVTDDGISIADIVRVGMGNDHGGVAVLTDKVSPPLAVLKVGTRTYNPFGGNGPFYSSPTWFNDGSDATDNGLNYNDPNVVRGYLKIDYLAAACGEGTGYTRSFIGFTTSYDCHGNYGTGTAAFHVVQTQGADIWSTSDKFAFINKSMSSANATVKVRVDKMEYTNAWARAGIMLRAGLGANSRHVSMVVTPQPTYGSGNGIGLTVRTTDGGSTTETSPNVFSAPYWVLIQKTGNSFKGYMSATGTGDPVSNPGSWTQVGATTTVSFPGTYYAGLCQTAGNNSPVLLNTSAYSNVNF